MMVLSPSVGQNNVYQMNGTGDVNFVCSKGKFITINENNFLYMLYESILLLSHSNFRMTGSNIEPTYLIWDLILFIIAIL